MLSWLFTVQRVDRYVFFQLTKFAVLGSVVTVIVLLGLQLLRLADLIIRFDLDLRAVFEMLGGLALSFTPLVFPISVLFAALVFFGRLSSDHELVALYAMGLSPKRILKPAYVFSAAGLLATVFAALYFGPYGNRRFEYSIDDAFKRQVTTALRSGTFSEGFLGMVVFVDQINPLTQGLERVFIHDESTFQDPVSISAATGHYDQTLTEGTGLLRLNDGVLISQIPSKQIVRRVEFDEYKVYADFSRQTGNSRNSPRSMDVGELLKLRRENRQHSEIDPRQVWVEIAQRVALSFACLFFVPLAFVMSVDESRLAKSRAVFQGLVVVLMYWTIYFALMTWLLKTPVPVVRVHEWVSWAIIWVPNVIVMIATWAFYRRRLVYTNR